MELFSRVHEQGLTIMMVTHARNLISFGTRHLEMADGTVLEESRG
jgi:ABC-type lipoprotein export system ATPase subunit